jgi:hypothetical protein
LRIFRSPALLFTALAFGCGTVDVEKTRAGTRDTTTQAETRQDRVAHEWLVKLRPGIFPEQLTALYKPLGLDELKPIAPDLYLLRFLPEAQMTETKVREIGGDTLLYVQPNFVYQPF